MYESPIKVIFEDVQRRFEDGIYQAVQKVDIHVDRDELLKALQYDRGQYEKGLADAVQHEHWETNKDGRKTCSACGAWCICMRKDGLWLDKGAYCPCCGAKMDEEDEK